MQENSKQLLAKLTHQICNLRAQKALPAGCFDLLMTDRSISSLAVIMSSNKSLVKPESLFPILNWIIENNMLSQYTIREDSQKTKNETTLTTLLTLGAKELSPEEKRALLTTLYDTVRHLPPELRVDGAFGLMDYFGIMVRERRLTYEGTLLNTPDPLIGKDISHFVDFHNRMVSLMQVIQNEIQKVEAKIRARTQLPLNTDQFEAAARRLNHSVFIANNESTSYTAKTKHLESYCESLKNKLVLTEGKYDYLLYQLEVMLKAADEKVVVVHGDYFTHSDVAKKAKWVDIFTKNQTNGFHTNMLTRHNIKTMLNNYVRFQPNQPKLRKERPAAEAAAPAK